MPQAQADLVTKGGGAVPAPISGLALVDTGANNTSICEEVAKRLSLRVVDSVPINTPAGQVVKSKYIGEVEIQGFAKGNLWTMTGAELAAQGIIALIGTDVLCYCLLVYHGPAGTFTISV